MKTRLLIITGICVAAAIASLIILHPFETKYSKENPYEFSALVFYSKEPLSIMCRTNNCDTHLQLNISSKIPAVLQGYEICNGFSCTNVDDIHFSSKDHDIIPIFDQNNWKIGDKISIKVKVTTKYDETITHPEPIPVFIDLGESEINEMGVILQDSDFNGKNYSNQECADLFDKTFDTWKKYVDENYGGPGQPILEPLSVVEIISGWEGGQEFRDSDCRFRVNDWAYLVKHHDIVWGNVDWPNLESFKQKPEPEPNYNFDKTFTLIGQKSQYNLDYSLPNGVITDIRLDCDSLKLVLSIESTESKVLTLLLPDEIIGNIETILVDKTQWNYISYAGNTVTIMVPEKTNTIEIGGSYRDDQRNVECR